MQNVFATRAAIWEDFRQEVIAADLAAGIESPTVDDTRDEALLDTIPSREELNRQWAQRTTNS